MTTPQSVCVPPRASDEAAIPCQAPATEANVREILATLLHKAGDISGAIHVREGSCRQINSRVALEAVRVASAHQAPATDAELREILAKELRKLGCDYQADQLEWTATEEPHKWNETVRTLIAALAAMRTVIAQSTQSYADGMEDAAIADIAAERKRQIEVEGWTVEHDDEHAFGEMARAASAYALAGSWPTDKEDAALARDMEAAFGTDTRIGQIHVLTPIKTIWPWDWEWWKPTNRRRNLIKSAALIVAEIERLDRAAAMRAIEQRKGGER